MAFFCIFPRHLNITWIRGVPQGASLGSLGLVFSRHRRYSSDIPNPWTPPHPRPSEGYNRPCPPRSPPIPPDSERRKNLRTRSTGPTARVVCTPIPTLFESVGPLRPLHPDRGGGTHSGKSPGLRIGLRRPPPPGKIHLHAEAS